MVPIKNKAGTVDTFTDDDFKYYENNCRPGGCGVNDRHCFFGISYGSDEGFIDDKESLKDVAFRDHKKVTELLGPHGHDMIAITLGHLFEQNDTFIATIVDLPQSRQNFSIETQNWSGNQGCPFWKEVTSDEKKADEKLHISECGGCGGGDFTIKNLKTGEILQISSLMNHLILYHHFYEGNTSYRADPERMSRILEVDPKLFENAKWEVIARDEKGILNVKK